MTDADRAELAALDELAVDVRKRRARVFNRIRQRAYQARKVK